MFDTIQKAAEYIYPWFLKTEHQVLNEFAALPHAMELGDKGDYRSVFVPGSREDRVLLVAHADTVFQDTKKINPLYKSGMFFSGEKYRGLNKTGDPVVYGTGIGADDRAGCGILWLLKDLGHSLLITNCEEVGCLASAFIMSSKKRANLIQNHSFAIQFDRHGRNDLVFYRVGTKVFKKYCEEKTGYTTDRGTFTDIACLCRDICGVNISVGYKNEHTCNEILNMEWWLETATIAERWLSSKEQFPRFTLK